MCYNQKKKTAEQGALRVKRAKGGVCMTLSDISHGPAWVVWVIFVILLVMTIVFLTGNGGSLIAGYNVATKEEQEKYDRKKLCRTFGCGFVVVDLLILVMALGEAILPAWFAGAAAAIIIIDVIGIWLASEFICRRK